MLEIMSRYLEWWKNREVVKGLKGLNWSIGDMLGEALKLVWNIKDSEE